MPRIKKEKIESCVKQVKARQPVDCAKNNWKGKKCYNPWAVCIASINKSEKVNQKSKLKK
jgi:hypothetical protein